MDGPRRRFSGMKRAALLLVAGLLISGACAFAAAPSPPSNDEKEGTIAGTAIQRAQGGWLGVELRNNTFRLTFYNNKKNPIAADKSSAVLWWPVHYQPNNERTELLPTDNPAVLSSDYPVKSPHSFKLHISLLSGASADVESYVIDFSG
jgi:hypothetical protein